MPKGSEKIFLQKGSGVLVFYYICIMTQEKQAITVSQKIDASPWKKNRIMELLNLGKTKFHEKLRYNAWDDKEISILKKEGVIK